MAITDWPEGERPREKLLEKGAAALSDAELLAIFLRVGVTGKSAVDLARDLLQHFGGLTDLFNAGQNEFTRFPGMGPAKYAQLQAVLEMSRRALKETVRLGNSLESPRAVREYLRLLLGGKRHEVFTVIFLNAANHILSVEEMFRGTLMEASVYPREIVQRALQLNAAGVILAHNHPSGVAEPSQADRCITDQIKSALALVDVMVVDHFIVSRSREYSFAEHGLL